MEKRAAQFGTLFDRMWPKGYERESFKGKTANVLDAARIEELRKYVERAEAVTKVPGVAFGLIQGGKVVWTGGVGPRELGKKEQVDGKTLFMIASNTKALTTLMLAREVAQKKLRWDEPVIEALPSFKLGSAEITPKVEVRHLICACTGLPRQDMEWLFEWKGSTPESVMKTLGTMVPTSGFGELFQYSNPMAAAGGYVGGHVLFPKLELGAAYDKAMQQQVFDPLGMKRTTFDYAKALKDPNHAMPHSPDQHDQPAAAAMEENYSIIASRPAGAAWSSVEDMLRYVQLELAEGKLPDGKEFLPSEVLLERRVPQVAIGKDSTYGMGLMTVTQWDVEVVHHGGDMIGFHSDMMWIPSAGVGAVILTNGDPGWLIRGAFRRKLLEVLYDGKPEADEDVAVRAKAFFEAREAERKLVTVPADAKAAGELAARYESEALGSIVVTHEGAKTVFDFGEFKSEVGSKQNPDGTINFVTLLPGLDDIGLTVGAKDGKKTLVLRDGQHEYAFVEK